MYALYEKLFLHVTIAALVVSTPICALEDSIAKSDKSSIIKKSSQSVEEELQKKEGYSRKWYKNRRMKVVGVAALCIVVLYFVVAYLDKNLSPMAVLTPLCAPKITELVPGHSNSDIITNNTLVMPAPMGPEKSDFSGSQQKPLNTGSNPSMLGDESKIDLNAPAVTVPDTQANKLPKGDVKKEKEDNASDLGGEKNSFKVGESSNQKTNEQSEQTLMHNSADGGSLGKKTEEKPWLVLKVEEVGNGLMEILRDRSDSVRMR